MIEVVRPGPLATVQDLGRPGYAHLGVPRSGAADAPSLRLANRLVGNPEDAAGIEFTLGNAALRFRCAAWIAVTGAPLDVCLDDRPHGMNAPLRVLEGGTLTLGTPSRGLRSYLAVRGGVNCEPTLGSRSTDLLSHLGPPPLAPGTHLPVGAADAPITVDLAPVPSALATPVLHIVPGPRDDWFVPDALDVLTSAPYTVTPAGNRVGVRLDGPLLERAREGELSSEGMVTGALQVPPNGRPILFLTDHPTTGGYPVIAVVRHHDIPTAAQLRPGDPVRFRLS
ncbi:biotin-dependent carboxyltransferase family protein [Actinomadura logoneensis]|uniref:Biotin-dependent carboxyltransferase family protein n=1 Tax=Actinomadura logoneensis TaxID=2293572 RepID=A0A372JBJ9_9ACTN|nr:biotin-dependent carboxyltransferase family protein [Actinomadura logoneensis]RFU37385.1 biotin-dependent carboxyltransferase family protein [Actinomadura logoneensis]